MDSNESFEKESVWGQLLLKVNNAEVNEISRMIGTNIISQNKVSNKYIIIISVISLF